MVTDLPWGWCSEADTTSKVLVMKGKAKEKQFSSQAVSQAAAESKAYHSPEAARQEKVEVRMVSWSAGHLNTEHYFFYK